jgi:hypothetical protein
MSADKKLEPEEPERMTSKVKFEVFGEEMLEREVKKAGTAGGFTCRPSG